MNPEYVDIPEPLKGFDSVKIKEILKKLEIYRNAFSKIDDMLKLEYSFSKFWNLCENPKPFVYYIKNKVYITRDSNLIEKLKEVIKLKEKSAMVFVDEVPERHGGRTGYDIEAMLVQIPDGKAWKVGSKDYPSVATVREYVKKNHAKDYDAVQRTDNGAKFLFVSKIPQTQKPTKTK